VGIIITTKFGQPLAGSNGRMAGEDWRPGSCTAGTVIAEIDPLPLHSDTYRVSVYLGNAAEDFDAKPDVIEFDYISPRFYPTRPALELIGSVDIPWRWSLQRD
jgi:lipopolysaccharide transport system ATP-binding protein